MSTENDITWNAEIGRSLPRLPSDGLLEKEKEEDEGPSPLAMGLLQLGASMMRDEGWKDRPITLGESLGKAIPYGIAGYYNQDERNRINRANDQAERQAAQQQQLLQAKTLTEEAEKQRKLDAFTNYVEGLPDELFNIPQDAKDKVGRLERRKTALIEQFKGDASGAYERIEKLRDNLEERGKPTTGDTEAAIHLRNSIPGFIQKIKENNILSEEDKNLFLNKYGYINPNTLTHSEMKEMRKDYQALLGSTRGKKDLKTRNESYRDALMDRYSLGDTIDDGFDLSPDNLAELKQIMTGITDPEKQYAALEALSQKITKEKMATDQIQSMSGEQLLKEFGDDFKGVNKDLIYNVRKNPDGSVQIVSGTDYTDPAALYTKEMVESQTAVMETMGLITASQKESYNKLGITDPEGTVRMLQKAMADNLGSTMNADPNEGKVLLGKDIFETSEDGKSRKRVEGLQDNKAYYWDKGINFWKPVDDKAFEKGMKLSAQYNSQAKLYTQSLNAYNGLIAAFTDSVNNPEGAGVSDMTMLRAFLIMLEPNSVVRESEFATAAQAQGMAENLKTVIDRVENGAFLSPKGRQAYLNAARSYMATVRDQYLKQREQYLEMADRYGVDRINIGNAFQDKDGNDIVQGLPSPGQKKNLTQAEWDALWNNEAVDWQHGRTMPSAAPPPTGGLTFGAGNVNE